MKLKILILSAVWVAGAPSAYAATECAKQIQAIERRMNSAGASEVTGKPPSPDAKAQASNAAGQAPAPVDPSQKATPEKMKQAQALLEKAKSQDNAGDKQGCQATMQQVQTTMGAVP